ncbi:hypothetical protein O9H85_36670 [Paenibacillus filicis]|uniref:Polymerase beta nucleotidyltransferase domain-containing protein n=1 Tax=Paenibacillus gyeongsangnamensis TaxID=3388067 RepID=A0ABT4QLJ9_9BACL|nr:hypothetical protein [Paenibacillus filicis]MCZ8517749.1 hypothetical protein [Paenibacillus filicis]
MRMDNSTINAIYKEALQAFVERTRNDDQIIAAILLGSLSYDQVWEKSDIDMKLIVQDQKLIKHGMCFVENDITINASIQTRDEFKRWVEKSVSTSFNHSYLLRGTLLFTKDKSLEEYFANIRYIGERDRQLQLLQLGCFVLGALAKAEKWLYIKEDELYSAFWMIKMIDTLAQIEVIRNGEVPMRESVQQAMRFNPDFFRDVYVGLVGGSVDKEKVKATLERIVQFMQERELEMFRPILDYLKQEQDVRSISEMAERLGTVVRLEAGALEMACSWLVNRGHMLLLPTEAKATPKSRVYLDEPAYMLEEEDDFT